MLMGRVGIPTIVRSRLWYQKLKEVPCQGLKAPVIALWLVDLFDLPYEHPVKVEMRAGRLDVAPGDLPVKFVPVTVISSTSVFGCEHDLNDLVPCHLCGPASKGPPMPLFDVWCDGYVHYTRPLGDPLLFEARNRPEYEIRPHARTLIEKTPDPCASAHCWNTVKVGHEFCAHCAPPHGA